MNMFSKIIVAINVSLCFSMLSWAESVHKATTWQISLTAEGFKPVTQEIKEESLDSRVIGVVSNRKAIEQAGSSFVHKFGTGSVFQVVGQVPDRRTMKWVRSVTSDNKKQFQYYLLRYKAKGICRDETNASVVSLTGKDNSEKVLSDKIDRLLTSD